MPYIKVDVPDLPEGYTPLEMVAVVKCLDEKGEPTLAIRASDGLMAWEAAGMLITASDTARADLRSDMADLWEDLEEEDTEDSQEE